jgi:hypothetical protein
MDFSEGSQFANLIVSAVGFFLLTYGRKTTDIPKVVVGLVMLVYPYFVSSAAVMIGIAVALVGGLWLFDSYL